MKYLAIALSALFLYFSCPVLTGCKNPEQAVHRSIGTVLITVDASMNGWGEWVRQGKASYDDRVRVKAAYETYQKAVAVAEKAAITAKKSPDGQPGYQTALTVVTAAGIELVLLIEAITQKK